jgi:hypothetical protein
MDLWMPQETTDKKGNYLFQRFCPWVAFQLIQNIMQLCIHAMGNCKLYRGQIKSMTNDKIVTTC